MGSPFRSFGVAVLERLGLTSRKKRKGIRPCKRRSYSFEPLERRELLSICVWDGGGDNKWNTAANWAGDVAPAANDDLVFAGTTQTSSQNDYTAGTQFHSIEFQNTTSPSAETPSSLPAASRSIQA